MGERLVEGFWDCPYCGRKRISGLKRECSCGAERGEDVKFYMDGVHYVDEEVAKTISKNPDWLCSYCGALVSDNEDTCHNCGASKSESEMNYFQNRAKKEKKEQEEKQENQNQYSEDLLDDTEKKLGQLNDRISQTNSTIQKYRREIDYPERYDENKPAITFKEILKYSAIAIVLFAVVLGLFYLFVPKPISGTVDGFQWERSLEVEIYKAVEESDWSIPSGGRLLYQKQEVRSYRQVLDHYETKTKTYTEQVFDHYETYYTYKDNGNGTFTEQSHQRPVYRTETRTETYQEPVYRNEPVYDTKYYYEIERWVHKETLNSSGTDQTPYYAEYNYKENEREGFKTSDYTILVTDEKGKQHEYDVEYDLWKSLVAGQEVKLKVDIFGHATLDLEEKDE